MVFFHALGAMDFVGRKILRAVQGQKIIAVQKAKVPQSPVALQSREDISEGRPEVFRVDGVQDFSHASVARHVFHAEDHPQVLFIRLSTLVESQHGRVLQSEHGQSAHQRVGQADRGVAGAGIGDVLEGFPDTANPDYSWVNQKTA